MSARGWLGSILVLAAILVGNILAADVPCVYDESGFKDLSDSEASQEGSQVAEGLMLGGPGQMGMPNLSEPVEDVKPKIEKIKAAVEPASSITHNKAVEIALQSPGQYNIEQICYIYKYLMDNWKYVPDPRGVEVFSSASNTIHNGEDAEKKYNETIAGAGDCDDFAILMSSLIESISGTTRIIMAYNEKEAHAYAEVYLGNKETNLTKAVIFWLKNRFKCSQIYGHLSEENNGFWLNLDMNSSHPGGPLYRSKMHSIAYIGKVDLKTIVELPSKYSLPIKLGTLKGTVKDENGNPLASTVVATGHETEHPYSVNNSGTFELRLPPGDYQVTARKPGYTFTQEEIAVLEAIAATTDLTGHMNRQPNIQIVTEAVDSVKRCVYYTRDDEGHQVFKIKVYITGPDLSMIKSVKYSLHQTFERPEHVSTDPSDNFAMILWSWGRFAMPVTVTTKDGNEYEYMYPFTFRAQLEDAQRRGYRFIDATGSWEVIGGY